MHNTHFTIRHQNLQIVLWSGRALRQRSAGGRAPGSAEVLIELSRALDVSIDYLLLGRRPAGIDRLVGGIADLLEEARALQAGSATGDDVSSMEPSVHTGFRPAADTADRGKQKGA